MSRKGTLSFDSVADTSKVKGESEDMSKGTPHQLIEMNGELEEFEIRMEGIADLFPVKKDDGADQFVINDLNELQLKNIDSIQETDVKLTDEQGFGLELIDPAFPEVVNDITIQVLKGGTIPQKKNITRKLVDKIVVVAKRNEDTAKVVKMMGGANAFKAILGDLFKLPGVAEKIERLIESLYIFIDEQIEREKKKQEDEEKAKANPPKDDTPDEPESPDENPLSVQEEEPFLITEADNKPKVKPRMITFNKRRFTVGSSAPTETEKPKPAVESPKPKVEKPKETVVAVNAEKPKKELPKPRTVLVNFETPRSPLEGPSQPLLKLDESTMTNLRKIMPWL